MAKFLSPIPEEPKQSFLDKVNEYLIKKYNQIIGPSTWQFGGNDATPSAIPTPPPYQHKIEIPSAYDEGKTTLVPHNQAQLLMEVFDDINEATRAATELHHPKSQTYSPAEIIRLKGESWNTGENTQFGEGEMKAPNKDDNGNIISYDYGYMRNNDKTFEDMQSRKQWNDQMVAKGLQSIADLANTRKSMEMARLRGDMAIKSGQKRWQPWYAAKLEDRY